jgi:hypothetical protein
MSPTEAPAGAGQSPQGRQPAGPAAGPAATPVQYGRQHAHGGTAKGAWSELPGLGRRRHKCRSCVPVLLSVRANMRACGSVCCAASLFLRACVCMCLLCRAWVLAEGCLFPGGCAPDLCCPELWLCVLAACLPAETCCAGSWHAAAKEDKGETAKVGWPGHCAGVLCAMLQRGHGGRHDTVAACRLRALLHTTELSLPGRPIVAFAHDLSSDTPSGCSRTLRALGCVLRGCLVLPLQVKARVQAYKALPAAEKEKTDPVKYVYDGIRLVVSTCCCYWGPLCVYLFGLKLGFCRRGVSGGTCATNSTVQAALLCVRGCYCFLKCLAISGSNTP